MPLFANIPMPLQFTRQYNKAPYLDMVFETTADRRAYLSSPRRYGGMIVSDKELQLTFLLNTAEDAWLPGAGSTMAVGLGSKEFTLTLDGSAGAGQVGGLTVLPIDIDIPIGAFIWEVSLDVFDGLTAVDGTAFITLGVETDDPTSAFDSVSGLVTQLNSNGVTKVNTTSLAKATAARKLVMAVGGSNITAGQIKVIVIITDQLVNAGGGGGGGSETWQQTLINGSALTQSNTIDNSGFGFIMNGVNGLLLDLNDNGSTIGVTDGSNNFFGLESAINSVFIGADGGNNTAILVSDASEIINLNAANGVIFSGYGVGTHLGTATKLLAVDSGGGVIEVALAAGGAVTASNGLSIDGGSGDVILGGALSQTTNIDSNGFTINLSTTSGVNPLFIQSDSSPALQLYSTNGTTFTAYSEEDLAAVITSDYANTNSILSALRVTRTTSGTAANGIGSGIQLDVQTITNGSSAANILSSKWTDATFASRTSEFSIAGVNSAATNILLRISGGGIFTLPQGLSNFLNNAAAIIGGLVVGNLYRNGDIVQIVH